MTPYRALRKYLERYAEPEARAAAGIDRGRWQQVVVIPACGEAEGLQQTLHSLRCAASRPTLAIVVINGRIDAPAWVDRANHLTLQRLREALDPDRAPGEIGTLGRWGGIDLWLVDRASPGRRFAADQGVGLARKIGADLAAALFARGAVISPWIRFTDADVDPPPDYLADPAGSAGCSALLYPFVHQPPAVEPDASALRLYEISLRYYALGLHHAGSPYAFHTVGSTIAVEAGAYARVRGVPRRQAAEDFYLLSKLAKVGPLLAMDRTPLSIRGRRSDRVPFGTGAAIGRMTGQGIEDHLFYDPRLFEALGAWVEGLAAVARGGRMPRPDGLLGRVFDANRSLVAPLERIARRALDQRQALRQLHVHFDALRTLRLIHRGRDAVLPSRPWREALQRASFVDRITGDQDLISIAEMLWQQERSRLHGVRFGVDVTVEGDRAARPALRG